MNDTCTIDLQAIQQPSPRTSDASMLQDLTRHLDEAILKIETRWEEFPSQVQEDFVHFAYAAIESDNKQDKVRALFDRSRSAWYLFLLGLKGEQEAYVEYKVAVRRFVEVILDAVERESQAYQETLAEILEAGLSDEKPMTVEEAREQRRQLRHQVFE